MSNANEEPSGKRRHNVNRKLKQNQQLKDEYEKIVHKQLKDGVIENTKKSSTSERVFYMPHKPVIKENASTTKVKMVFDASTRPHPTANSVNECMHTGPLPLQPLLWGILIIARLSTHLLLANVQKAFPQVGLKEDDRDAFRFLFDINGQVELLRFTRVPFGVEASPFMLGATLQHHFNLQPEKYQKTIESLIQNTYVDYLMKTGSDIADLEDLKREATEILDDAKFPGHKWESNVEELDNESNPSKILGHRWNKREDTLEIRAESTKETPVTKRHILKELSSIYDPLGIISPTMVEGKRTYREACDEKVGWNSEVSSSTSKDWIKWRQQLRNVKIPRSLAREIRKVKTMHLHFFADASFTACLAVTIAVIEHSSGTVKGLLTSMSRIAKRGTSIPRLELVSGQMAANMAKNLVSALRRWPIASVTVWMDSLVALFWIASPENTGKSLYQIGRGRLLKLRKK